MKIVPIQQIQSIEQASKIGGAEKTNKADTGFAQVFENAVEQMESIDKTVKGDSYDLSFSEVDNPALMMMNSAKLDIALNMFVQVRNKALDAYNEIMRINL